MDKETAQEILGDTIQKDNSLYCLGHYISWNIGDEDIVLDCSFTVDELEAMVWWIRNNG